MSDRHLPFLLHQLKDHAHKSKEIALHLGFRPGEVSNILASPNLIQGAPVSWLQALLEAWIQWAPGDSRGSDKFATLLSLKNALNKAGLAAAAHDLKVESNEVTAMGGASATGSRSTLGQPSLSTYPQTSALPYPLNEAHGVPFQQPPYGRKCTA